MSEQADSVVIHAWLWLPALRMAKTVCVEGSLRDRDAVCNWPRLTSPTGRIVAGLATGLKREHPASGGR